MEQETICMKHAWIVTVLLVAATTWASSIKQEQQKSPTNGQNVPIIDSQGRVLQSLFDGLLPDPALAQSLEKTAKLNDQLNAQKCRTDRKSVTPASEQGEAKGTLKLLPWNPDFGIKLKEVDDCTWPDIYCFTGGKAHPLNGGGCVDYLQCPNVSNFEDTPECPWCQAEQRSCGAHCCLDFRDGCSF
jgi:hypothetical protein